METDLYLLWLILLTTVAVKVLRAPVAAACNMLAGVVLRVPLHVTDMRSEVQQLKRQLSEINMIDRFAEHSKLKRVIQAKETDLVGIERSRTSKAWLVTTVLQTTGTVSLQLLRIGVIVMNRGSPVAVLPVEQTWPLGAVFSFPTGVPGAIGTPIWGLMCVQAVDMLACVAGQWRT